MEKDNKIVFKSGNNPKRINTISTNQILLRT